MNPLFVFPFSFSFFPPLTLAPILRDTHQSINGVVRGRSSSRRLDDFSSNPRSPARTARRQTARPAAEPRRAEPVDRLQPPDRLTERLDRLLGKNNPVPGSIRRPARRFPSPRLGQKPRPACRRPRRPARSQNLRWPETAVPGHAQLAANCLVALPAGQRHRRPGQPCQAAMLALADHRQAASQPIAGLDGQIDPLVGHQRGDAYVAVVGGSSEGGKTRVDRRVDHLAGPPVTLGNAIRHRAADGQNA